MMKRIVALIVIGLGMMRFPCAQEQRKSTFPDVASLKAQADVPVERVILFNSGVGYFEHAGKIKGHAKAELRFKSDQINDLLKSLVLEDLDGGLIRSVVYPLQDPLSKILHSFQVDISSNPSLGDLLNQLRGARVKVSVQAETIEGIILGLEKQKRFIEKKRVVWSWLLNVISDSGIRSIELSQIQKIELEDVELRDELNKALLVLSQARDQDLV